MGDIEVELSVEFFASKKLMNIFGVFQLAGYEDVITDVKIGINLFPISVICGDDENIINALIGTIAHEYLHKAIFEAEPEVANDENIEEHEYVVDYLVKSYCPEIKHSYERFLKYITMWEKLEEESFVAYV